LPERKTGNSSLPDDWSGEYTDREERDESMKDIERRDETVLEGILRVTGRTGGTVHQYLDVFSFQYERMAKNFKLLHSIGIEFPSIAAMKKLAKEYSCEINWDGTRGQY